MRIHTNMFRLACDLAVEACGSFVPSTHFEPIADSVLQVFGQLMQHPLTRGHALSHWHRHIDKFDIRDTSLILYDATVRIKQIATFHSWLKFDHHQLIRHFFAWLCSYMHFVYLQFRFSNDYPLSGRIGASRIHVHALLDSGASLYVFAKI